MTPTGAKTTTSLRGLLALAAVVLGALAIGAAPAAAATPCWKQVLNDWFVDGRIDRTYPIACYTEASQHIPPDAEQYSTAPQDIQRALLAAIRQDRGNGPGIGGGTGGSSGSGSSGGGNGGSSGGDSSGRGSASRGGSPGASGGGGSTADRGPLTRVIDWLGPSNASSIPLPLLVLAGVALLLLAGAAASWFARRMQSRRLRPAAPPPPPPQP